MYHQHILVILYHWFQLFDVSLQYVMAVIADEFIMTCNMYELSAELQLACWQAGLSSASSHCPGLHALVLARRIGSYR